MTALVRACFIESTLAVRASLSVDARTSVATSSTNCRRDMHCGHSSTAVACSGAPQ